MRFSKKDLVAMAKRIADQCSGKTKSQEYVKGKGQYLKKKKAGTGWEKYFKEGEYLYNFFAEKNIPYQMWELEDDVGLTHIISNEVVVEHISKTRGSERRQIENILRKIDLHNGRVNHFLKHLAQGLANIYGAKW